MEYGLDAEGHLGRRRRGARAGAAAAAERGARAEGTSLVDMMSKGELAAGFSGNAAWDARALPPAVGTVEARFQPRLPRPVS